MSNNASYTTISENYIAHNKQQGIYAGVLALENLIYHNNFVNNTGHTDDGANFWDRNYWSDYEGVDTDGDGFGDTETPHYKDHYPLIVPKGSIPVFHKETRYDCIIDGSMTVSRFSLDEDKTISLNINGEGYVNLTFPRELLDGSFQIFINNTQIPYKALWDTDHNFISFEHTTSVPVSVVVVVQMKLQGDLNSDGKIDIRDIATVAKHYGETFEDP